jgi:formiminoglutamase
MTSLIPYSGFEMDESADDMRLGHIIGRQAAPGRAARVVLCGFPSDEGVRRNGGRPGAADGPSEIRRFLYRMTPGGQVPMPLEDLLRSTIDLGDVRVEEMEAGQEALGNAIAPYLREDVIVIVLGGGHETAFGHFLGYAEAGLAVDILNLDAHTDVRALKQGRAHSGSPFRQAYEHPSGALGHYAAAGLQPHSVSSAHADYVRSQGGSLIWREEINDERLPALFMGGSGRRMMVTLDLDVVDQSQAPGVSAPATNGISARHFVHAARLAGRSTVVSSIDICELNPRFDRDGQTARLAALALWHFLLGIAERYAAVDSSAG